MQVASVGPPRAPETDLGEGAVVLKVQEDGLSAGILEPDDIIGGAIVGEESQDVNGPGDLMHIVSGLEIGSVLKLEVVRGEEQATVEISLGSIELKASGLHRPPRSGHRPNRPQPPLLKLLPNHLLDRLWSGEFTFEGEDCPWTVNVLAGTIEDVNLEDSELTLTLKGGSESVTYQINDETWKMSRGHLLDLDGLEVGDESIVVVLDDETRLVLIRGQRMGAPPGDAIPEPSNRRPFLGLGRGPLGLDLPSNFPALQDKGSGFSFGFGQSGDVRERLCVHIERLDTQSLGQLRQGAEAENFPIQVAPTGGSV